LIPIGVIGQKPRAPDSFSSSGIPKGKNMNQNKKREAILNNNRECILKEVASRFGIAVGRLAKLHDSIKIDQGKEFIEKSLYEYKRGGKSFLLRLTVPYYVDFELIKGEADWINYLADNGIHVPRVIPSLSGKLVEAIEVADSSLAAVAFEKVEGRLIDFGNSDEWNTKLFEKYGKAVGKMHVLTKRYEPQDESFTRMQWYEQDWFDIDRCLPRSEYIARRKCHDLIRMTHSLPKGRNSYGLIHGDAHPWNLLVHERNIILTDFDFCEYSWFVSDIAVALFYALMAPTEGMDKISFARCFMQNFMRGYSKENSIEVYWMKHIPTFLRLRMVSKFALHYQEWQSNLMSENRRTAFLEWKYKIENDIAYIDIDFSEFT